MGKARNIADLLNSSGKIDSADIDSSAQFYQFKNRIINGAMMIDQRNAGASVTPGQFGQYTLDRWEAVNSQLSKLTVQQSSVAPAGFTNSLLVTSSSAYSIGSSDYFFLRQKIEGFNTSDLGFGTANASTVTLSFWVRSSLTGTFGGSLVNSGNNRSYPFAYTISSANTWEQKSVTIAGDTTGTWLTTNGVGIAVDFGLGVGSTFSGTTGSWAGANLVSATGATSVVGTNGATFYITGVQLEKGSTATSFDYRPYGTELNLCKRYFQKSYDQSTAVGAATSNNAIRWYPDTTTNYASITSMLSVELRAAPTTVIYSTTGASGKIRNGDGNVELNAYVNASPTNSFHFSVNNTSVSTSTTLLVHFAASAEL